jgi:hypothetical protein
LAAGDDILSRFIDNPDSVLGLSAGQLGEASSMLINAPDAPVDMTAADLDGSIFLSDAYLTLAAMNAEAGGGLDEGTLAYYVMMQEIGHSLGLEEYTNTEQVDAGYEILTAHESTTTDETIEGLDSLDDLADMDFAATPGSDALDRLADMIGAEMEAESESYVFANGTDNLSELIAQYSSDANAWDQIQETQNEEALNGFVETYMEDFMASMDQGDDAVIPSDADMAQSLADAVLMWAQDNTQPAETNGNDNAQNAQSNDTQGTQMSDAGTHAEIVHLPDNDEMAVAQG